MIAQLSNFGTRLGIINGLAEQIRERRWQKDDYPSVSKSHWLWDHNNPEGSNGWLDFRFFKSIATVAGA